MPETKIVWVLGAGFSAGLGGPLLQRLLSPSSEGDLLVRYPDKDRFKALHGPFASQVRLLYRYGLTEGPITHAHTVHGQVLWANAEEFIDYLDTAAETRPSGVPNPHADRIQGIAQELWTQNVPVDDLRATARHLIAAECCAFLEGADPRREQWKPYRRWERTLTPNDTIITFNYDRVLELLQQVQNEDCSTTRGLKPSQLYFVTPGRTDDPGAWDGCTPVLKLHGSVDWQKQVAADPARSVVVTVQKDPLFALTCRPEELAIATPGPSKAREVRGYRALWDLATAALSQADAVVLVGFRFPQTDADPRERLLGALSLKKWEPRRELRTHIVLGTPGDHTARVKALLDFACQRRSATDDGVAIMRSFSTEVHPLFAQDFFTVFERAHL